MKVLVVGGGSVGRAIAAELDAKHHEVTIIDLAVTPDRTASLPRVEWLQGDACELAFLSGTGIDTADVLVAATGDDKANLVVSLLAKTEFGVPRTVGRVKNPKNEWMYDDTWGVDVMVSTPRMITSLVEEAVSVGTLVPVFTFRQSGGGETRIVELTLPAGSPMSGRTLGSVRWPADTVLVGVVRDGRPFAPSPHDTLEDHDELLFLMDDASRGALAQLLVPRPDDGTSATR